MAKKDVAEKLANGFKDMKDAMTNSDTAELFKNMASLGVNIAPLMAPLNMITAQIGAETTATVVNLMKEMFELMENPMIQTLLDKLIGLLNFIITNFATMVDWLDKILNLLQQSEGWGKFCDACSTLYNVLVEGLAKEWEEFIKAVTGHPTRPESEWSWSPVPPAAQEGWERLGDITGWW